jgi:hypothetical protein
MSELASAKFQTVYRCLDCNKVLSTIVTAIDEQPDGYIAMRIVDIQRFLADSTPCPYSTFSGNHRLAQTPDMRQIT